MYSIPKLDEKYLKQAPWE